ncbi:hypothetical protein LJ707_15890 [Mucilaginibacter sp. UR6-1]|uniref:hypothetical protein n=1 Tax=Mucilaginibacter sp. UR6-1 TaxID=1435643 RepID=UPI001E41DEF3|nr:hypothetical protein [Mucilaginibacter sp. UR6-1]MCC8410424.1 hypothetical protein [Mucilaginibacter sp. UR6-1]
MKTYRKPSISKLVAKFDNELKALLMSDLKAIKQAKNQFVNSMNNNGLSAA